MDGDIFSNIFECFPLMAGTLLPYVSSPEITQLISWKVCQLTGPWSAKWRQFSKKSLMVQKSWALLGSLSHYLQGFIHPKWFCNRISSINSMLPRKPAPAWIIPPRIGSGEEMGCMSYFKTQLKRMLIKTGRFHQFFQAEKKLKK